MMREAYPSLFPGKGCNELMLGYGFLEARRIILNFFPQCLNRPYIRHWARPRPQLGAAAMLAASLMVLPSLVPARPLCTGLNCTRKEALRPRGTQLVFVNPSQVTDQIFYARSQMGLRFSCYSEIQSLEPIRCHWGQRQEIHLVGTDN